MQHKHTTGWKLKHLGKSDNLMLKKKTESGPAGADFRRLLPHACITIYTIPTFSLGASARAVLSLLTKQSIHKPLSSWRGRQGQGRRGLKETKGKTFRAVLP